MTGKFITIEGPDGSGKSTQIKLLIEYLTQRKIEVLFTREPGGTPISEKIRNIILDTEHEEMTGMTEALLYAAARAQHVEQLIRPALGQNKIILCDRFVDSSVVYQGFARGLGMEKIEELNHQATGGLTPDLTICLDVPASCGLNRKQNQMQLDRLEKETVEFHEKVRQGYSILAEKYKRIKVIDGTKEIGEISTAIIEVVEKLLEKDKI